MFNLLFTGALYGT